MNDFLTQNNSNKLITNDKDEISQLLKLFSKIIDKQRSTCYDYFFSQLSYGYLNLILGHNCFCPWFSISLF